MKVEKTPTDSLEATPVVGIDGKVLPGLFAFDVLNRDPVCEARVREFVEKENLQEKLNKVESSK